jgi:hypothetical protein
MMTQQNNEEKKFKSSYTKSQRIIAMIAAILLIAMYIVTLIAGITTSPAAPELFKMSVGASILLPIMFWLYIRFWKLFAGKEREQ